MNSMTRESKASGNHEAIRPRRKRRFRWYGWFVRKLLRRVQPASQELGNELAEAFARGLPVRSRQGEPWVAVLDALEADDGQYLATVRYHRGAVTKDVHRVSITERRYRKATPRDLTSSPTEPTLQFSFQPYVTLDENLALFREYSENELTRHTRRRRRV